MQSNLSGFWVISCLLLLSCFSRVRLCVTPGPPGSPVPGILQARTLQWVAISFSNAWKWKVKVKSLSRVRLLATPWTAACQASLSNINSQSLLRLMSIKSVMPPPTTSSTVVPFSFCLQSFPASGSFPRSQFFASGGQSIGTSASVSVLPMIIQVWFPLGLTGLIKSVEEGKIVKYMSLVKLVIWGGEINSLNRWNSQWINKPKNLNSKSTRRKHY